MRLFAIASGLTLATVMELGAPVPAAACSCDPTPQHACQRIGGGQSIFVGTITDVEESGDGEVARFAVKEWLAGNTGTQATVFTHPALCGNVAFPTGATMLVYATPMGNQRLMTSLCDPNRFLPGAEEEVEYLRRASRGDRQTVVYGSVVGVRAPSSGIGVLIRGAGGKRRIATDAHGGFAVYGLPAGRYTIRVETPGAAATAFDLPRRGCIPVWLIPDVSSIAPARPSRPRSASRRTTATRTPR